MKELMIEAIPENLYAVLDFVNTELDNIGVDIELQTQISIAVGEVFSNIVYYAYHPDVGSVTVRITIGHELSIEFEDCGVPYNPLETPIPDITASLDERKVGGLGVFMVRNIMDEMEYRHEENKNILTIKKGIVMKRG